jgi:hypothetical protein
MEGETLMKSGDERCVIADDLKLLYECATFGNSVTQEEQTAEVDMSELLAKGLQRGNR